jgi:hypothetical protein
LGAVRLDDVVPFDAAAFAADPWAGGPWCWTLAGARPFARPLACKGRLGLWSPTPAAALRRALREVGLAK